MKTVVFNGEEFFVKNGIYTSKNDNKKYIYKWGSLHPYWMKNSSYLEKIGKQIDQNIEKTLETNLKFLNPDYKLTKYSKARLKYLKVSKRDLYRELGFTGKLPKHLMEIDSRAKNYINKYKDFLEEKLGVTENLKKKDMKTWEKLKDKVQSILDEIIFKEMIYK